ncbi:MAG TPA: plastocyanin/azurin family copper-binding protein [Gemmatimonadales bacterium]|nr:plastocyanin/azurin family copper-binding protein [Gemmatimonadales bacterium]
MPGKVQHGLLPRRNLAAAGLVVAIAAAAPSSAVSGRVTMLDRENQPSDDVGQAVIWLSGAPAQLRPPVQTDMGTSGKEFSPHVLVVPMGSKVSFSNYDPFNHNVFSLSEGNPFDLGLYGRGESRSVRFDKPGLVRVYCNVHAQMSALVLVRDTPWYTQPTTDGSFALSAVPAGEYTLHAWHERAAEVTRPLTVPAEGVEQLALELDARGHEFKPHLNKHGQPYPQQGRRY